MEIVGTWAGSTTAEEVKFGFGGSWVGGFSAARECEDGGGCSRALVFDCAA